MTRPAPLDVLALPTATALRMVVVAVALAVSGLFVGTALHNALLGQAWQDALQDCLSPGQLLPATAEEIRCQGPAQARLAGVALLGVIGAVVLAVGVTAVAPVVIRRRRRLVPADPRFSAGVAAVGQLAAAAGVRPPGVLIVPGARAEPFCLGRPGDYRIALPRKLALRRDARLFPLFDAQVGHEVAHLAHHDVALSWLARSLWYVLGPLLALPVAVALLEGEPVLAVDELWRAAVLLGVVLLVVRELMRAREHDADLRAARLFGVGPVLDAALAARPPVATGWRAALHWHPAPERRRAVLADPPRAGLLTWRDGLSLGFLVALALPLIIGSASAGLQGLAVAGLPGLVGASVLGPLFGATVGIGLWRHALVARSCERPSGTRPVALGVLAGSVLGQLTSLAGTGAGRPSLVLLVPVVLAGTTVLVGGLGELWVSGVGGTRRPAAVTAPALLLGGTTATAALWAASQGQLVLEEIGWPLLAAWLTTPAALVVPGVAAVVLAVATAWALRPRRDGSNPPWWGGVPRLPATVPGRGAVATGLLAGFAGGVALATYRVAVGPSADEVEAVQRVDAALLGAGLVGAAVVVVLGLMRGPVGAAAGLVAGPLAALTTGAGFLLVAAVVAGNPLVLTPHVLGGAVSAGFLFALPAALVAVVPVPPVRATGLVAAVALLAGGATAGVAMSGRATLVPGLSAVLPGYSEVGSGPARLPDTVLAVPRDLYVDVVAGPLLDGRKATADALAALQAEKPPNDVAAARIRTEILPTVQSMLDLAESVRVDDPQVTAVHEHALSGARLHVAGFTAVADALERGDAAQWETGSQQVADGNAEWQQWVAGVATL